MAGIVFGIGAGAALAGTAWVDEQLAQRLLWLAGVVLIQLRGMCNVLDGVVAVETQQVSPSGQLYNEVPDRISDAATLIGAGFAIGGDPWLGCLAALLAVFVAYVRAQSTVAGAPQDYCGPMAKPMRMTVVTIAAAYIAATPSAWQPAWGPQQQWGIMAAGLLLIIVGAGLTAARRPARAGRALRSDR